uniref:HAUS augmin-like complex subunit 6 N-terminal domain-containing protein n=1 Tax=Biomphalaria glabrata TaxID=6526 RepID=A0A2C9M7U9_BIOGL
MEITTMNSLFFTNLHLLGLDIIDMEAKYKIPFKEDMFTLPNKAGSEAILHFLFHRLNPSLAKEQFRDCWPLVDKNSEHQFRKVCNNWLTQIQEESVANLPRINTSLFLTPGGRKFIQFVYSFSTYVLMQVMKTEQGWVNQVVYPSTNSFVLTKLSMTALNDYSSMECEEFFDQVHLLIAANRHWKHYVSDLIQESRKVKKLLRESESEKKNLEKQLQEIEQKHYGESPTKKIVDKTSYDTSTYKEKRMQRMTEVTNNWKQISFFNDNLKDKRGIIQSIVENSFSKYSLDATALGIRVPNILLRESSAMFAQLEVDNIYKEGCLNLVSTLHLWNVALNCFKEHLQKEKLPDFSNILPLLTTQKQKHLFHLKAAKELRDEVTKKALPRLTYSTDVLKKATCLKIACKSKNTLNLGLTTPSTKLKRLSHSSVVTLSQSPIAVFLQDSIAVTHKKDSAISANEHLQPLQFLNLPTVCVKSSNKGSKVPINESLQKVNKKISMPLTLSKHEKTIPMITDHTKIDYKKTLPVKKTLDVSKHAIDDSHIDEVVQSVLNTTTSSVDSLGFASEIGNFSPLSLVPLDVLDSQSSSLTLACQTILNAAGNHEEDLYLTRQFSGLPPNHVQDVSHERLEGEVTHSPESQDINNLSLQRFQNDLESQTKINFHQTFLESSLASTLARDEERSEHSSLINHSRLEQSNLQTSANESLSLLHFSDHHGNSDFHGDIHLDKSYNSFLDAIPQDFSDDLVSPGRFQESDHLLLSPTFEEKKILSETEEHVISGPERSTAVQTIQDKLSALRQKASDILDISLDSSDDDL